MMDPKPGSASGYGILEKMFEADAERMSCAGGMEMEADLVPELVRERPALYAQGPAPPPPGQAYRMGSGSVTSDNEDEVRRRRLHRFS